jgi:hypothetical protein
MKPESEKERDAWERALKQQKCTLHEALIGELLSGAPVGPYVTARVIEAVDKYLSGDEKDFAEWFGLPIRKRERNRLKKMKEEIEIRHAVNNLVLSSKVSKKAGEKSKALVNPLNFENSVFTELEKRFAKKGKTIENIYYSEPTVKFDPPLKPQGKSPKIKKSRG